MASEEFIPLWWKQPKAGDDEDWVMWGVNQRFSILGCFGITLWFHTECEQHQIQLDINIIPVFMSSFLCPISKCVCASVCVCRGVMLNFDDSSSESHKPSVSLSRDEVAEWSAHQAQARRRRRLLLRRRWCYLVDQNSFILSGMRPTFICWSNGCEKALTATAFHRICGNSGAGDGGHIGVQRPHQGPAATSGFRGNIRVQRPHRGPAATSGSRSHIRVQRPPTGWRVHMNCKAFCWWGAASLTSRQGFFNCLFYFEFCQTQGYIHS